MVERRDIFMELKKRGINECSLSRLTEASKAENLEEAVAIMLAPAENNQNDLIKNANER